VRRIMVKVAPAFGGDDNTLAPAFQGRPQQLFAVPVAVAVRRIKERTAKLDGRLNGAE
jgi:hypothetical protein